MKRTAHESPERCHEPALLRLPSVALLLRLSHLRTFRVVASFKLEKSMPRNIYVTAIGQRQRFAVRNRNLARYAPRNYIMAENFRVHRVRKHRA
jgi:hypothetical protein